MDREEYGRVKEFEEEAVCEGMWMGTWSLGWTLMGLGDSGLLVGRLKRIENVDGRRMGTILFYCYILPLGLDVWLGTYSAYCILSYSTAIHLIGLNAWS